MVCRGLFGNNEKHDYINGKKNTISKAIDKTVWIKYRITKFTDQESI